MREVESESHAIGNACTGPYAARAALIFVGALAFLTVELGGPTLWSRDETTYADIARHLLDKGDWLTLHFNGRPWLNHPPLFYWLMALDFRVLGVSELAARLPAAVFGAAGVALTYVWGATFLRPRGATVAALALLLSLQYFMESRMAIIDAMFLFFISLTMLGFWRGWQGDARGWPLFFTACGLSCLTKGPWGLVFPFVVIVPFVLLGGAWARFAAIPWRWGLPLTALIGGSWYAIGAIRHGEAFVRTVLGYYFLGRLTTQVEHQGGPFWLYLPVLLAGFLPWSFLLPAALRALWTRRSSDEAARFLLCWIALPFIGLSLASTKLPSYAGFLLPPCALAVGAWADSLESRRPLVLPLASAALFSAALAVAVGRWGGGFVDVPKVALQAAQGAFIALAGGLALATIAALVPRRLPPPLFVAAGGAAAFLAVVALGFVPALEPTRSLRDVAAAVRATAPDGVPKAFYGPGVFGVIYYANAGPIDELVDESQLREWLERTPNGALVLRRETFHRLAPDLAARLLPVAETEHEMVARVR